MMNKEEIEKVHDEIRSVARTNNLALIRRRARESGNAEFDRFVDVIGTIDQIAQSIKRGHPERTEEFMRAYSEFKELREKLSL